MKKIYFLSFAVTSLFSSALTAQIVYTDIADGVPTGIDFNTDGTMEFDVTDGTASGDYITYFNAGANNNIHAIGSLSTTDWDVPSCVALGFTVNASNNWEGQGDCSLNAWGGTNPTITPNQDAYLAVRFNLTGTNVYYGWIRFSMNSSGDFTYKDYAYNSTPNTAINAGDHGSSAGIAALDNNSNIVIYPNPATTSFTIKNVSNVDITSIRITDLMGKVVNTIQVSNTTTATVDVSDFSKGVYLVTILANDQFISQSKITIQ